MSVRKYEGLDDEILDYIPMKVDDICDMNFNVTEFKKGIKEASYYGGIYVGLINIGIEDTDAIEMLKIILREKADSKSENKL